MDNKQFIILVWVIIFSTTILSAGIALQNGIYRCEKIIWDESGLDWFRLNKFTGELVLSRWNKETKNFEKIVKPKREI